MTYWAALAAKKRWLGRHLQTWFACLPLVGVSLDPVLAVDHVMAQLVPVLLAALEHDAPVLRVTLEAVLGPQLAGSVAASVGRPPEAGAAPPVTRHVGPPDLETPQLPQHAHVGAALVVAYGHRLAGSQTLEPPSD